MTNAVNIASLAGTGFSYTNKLFNGSFSIWQRGTSGFGVGGNTYNADRWCSILIGYTGGGGTFERGSFTAGQTDVAGNPQYYLRMNNVNITTDGTGLILTEQRIEDVTMLSGTTVTVSGYVRRSSGTTIALQVNQEFGTGGSLPVITNFATSVSVSSNWTYFSRTVTIPSVEGKTIGPSNYTAIRFIFVDKAGFSGFVIGDMATNSTVDFAMMQVEVGSSASPFAWRPYGTELQLCQRYYVGANTYYFTVGYDPNYTTYNSGGIAWNYQMRTTPTISIGSGGMDGHHAIAPTVRTGPVYYGVSLLYSGSALRTNVSCPAYVSFSLSAEL